MAATPSRQPRAESFRDEEGEASASPLESQRSVPRVLSLARGQSGRYRLIPVINTAVSIDATLSAAANMEEMEKNQQAMKRQRRWIRCLSILALALAIDVIFLSVKLTKNRQEMKEAEEAAEKESSSADASFFETNWMPLPSSDRLITKLAFGSCSSQYMPQPHLDTIARLDPDVVLLGGDNVYGDCKEDSCQALRQAYHNWTQHASFQGAIDRLPFIATLDDHDYGMNNANRFNPFKRTAKDLFHEFYPHLETAVPQNEDDGVYQVYTWGPPGRRVQVILLDTRYHRDPFPPNKDDPKDLFAPPYAPFKPSTASNQQMLSQEQWNWLAAVVRQPDIQIRFLVSSIQVLNDATGFECWRHLPKERERLYNLLRHECTSPIYLLSGDRHIGGFYQVDLNKTTNVTTPRSPKSGRPSLVEVTASSWTHTIPYGAFDNCTDAASCDELDPRRMGKFVRENNFATMEIDWERGNLTLALRRAETPPGHLYHGNKNHQGMASTGQILQARSFKFLG